MGDSQNDPLRVNFDPHIKVEFHGSTVTSDAGLLAYRELDDALGLTSTAATGLHDTRTGQNIQHSLLALWERSGRRRVALNVPDRTETEAAGGPAWGQALPSSVSLVCAPGPMTSSHYRRPSSP